jgi:hypothetical protein
MSICVAFNLSDGVVIAVDSATTMFSGPGAISKVFLDADKLFQLGKLRVGVATYGVAALHGRTIGSFIREFSLAPDNADVDSLELREVVERLRKFFFAYYVSFFEKIHSKPFDQIDAKMKGFLGLVVGGFSPGTFQSEIWEIVVPVHAAEYSARLCNANGAFGCNWFASSVPINRHLQGIDPALSAKFKKIFESILGRGITDAEEKQFADALKEHEYRLKFEGMPIQSGIACARFLVDLVLGHYRFAETHPIVGGKATVGVVTYEQNAFQILE